MPSLNEELDDSESIIQAASTAPAIKGPCGFAFAADVIAVLAAQQIVPRHFEIVERRRPHSSVDGRAAKAWPAANLLRRPRLSSLSNRRWS